VKRKSRDIQDTPKDVEDVQKARGLDKGIIGGDVQHHMTHSVLSENGRAREVG
jgi:hypothetical protein